MAPGLRIILIVASMITTIYMMKKIRQSKVQIEDSLYWIVFSVLLLIFSIFPIVPEKLSELIGIRTTVNFLFLFIIFLLLIKIFFMSIKISQMDNKIKEIVQKIALMEKEKKDKNLAVERKSDEEQIKKIY